MHILIVAFLSFISDILFYGFAEQQTIFCLLGVLIFSLFFAGSATLIFITTLLATETVIMQGQWGICLLYILPLACIILAIRESLAIPLWASASSVYFLTLLLHLGLTQCLILTSYTFMTICANLLIMNSLLKSLIKVD